MHLLLNLLALPERVAHFAPIAGAAVIVVFAPVAFAIAVAVLVSKRAAGVSTGMVAA